MELACPKEVRIENDFPRLFLIYKKKELFRNRTINGGKVKVRVHRRKKESKAKPLDFTNVGGIFVVLLGGIVVSLFVAIIEFLWHARKNHANHQHSVWWELVKELRFSVQCGASNRKALLARRCSQCTIDRIDTELQTMPNTTALQRRSHSHRSSSSQSINLGANLHPTKYRTTIERTSDLDKFDTLLMLASESSNRLDKNRKQIRVTSGSPSRKSVPLLLVESEAVSNHISTMRSPHVRFNSAESSVRSSIQSRQYEDGDGDLPSGSDVPSRSASSVNPRLPLRISRL